MKRELNKNRGLSPIVLSADDVKTTPDNQVILASAGTTVRLNPQTGEMDKPHPKVRIIDADSEIPTLLKQIIDNNVSEKTDVNPVTGEKMTDGWFVTDNQCAEKFDHALYQKYFEGK